MDRPLNQEEQRFFDDINNAFLESLAEGVKRIRQEAQNTISSEHQPVSEYARNVSLIE